MARRIVWSINAREDLREIRKFIARDSIYYSKEFIKEIKDKVAELTLFPERGVHVEAEGVHNLREVFVKKYRIIYQTSEDLVFIMAIVHGARNYEITE
ncbi:MAG: type II toxin-antitoxin system RelE/ParE family toxin [Deltaproteobacteria bacterium]|nr:type II toxin-antitoxin system RelE/ParE family toxin [Deltaproteobacteria bacterium]